MYQSEHHQHISITPLDGVGYKDHNGKDFDLIKSWTLYGPAWTLIREWNSYQNGRGAWLALVAHFEGDAQFDRVKDHAYASISLAKYYGKRKCFSFETEKGQVRNLLQGIKDNTAATIAAKDTLLVTPMICNNFANAMAHLSTTLQLSQFIQGPCSIGATTTIGG